MEEHPRISSFGKNRDPGFKISSVKNHHTYKGSLKESLLLETVYLNPQKRGKPQLHPVSVS